MFVGKVGNGFGGRVGDTRGPEVAGVGATGIDRSQIPGAVFRVGISFVVLPLIHFLNDFREQQVLVLRLIAGGTLFTEFQLCSEKDGVRFTRLLYTVSHTV